MKFTGAFLVPAPRAEVFDRLNDPHFFSSCLEGVSNLQSIDDDHYTATLDTKVAYIAFRFDVAVMLVERIAPTRVVAKVEGAPRGIVGRMTSTAIADLEVADDGHNTLVRYQMDVALAGKLGSIGQPVMKAKAAEMERGFVTKVRAAFAPAGGPSVLHLPPAAPRRSLGAFLKAIFQSLARSGHPRTAAEGVIDPHAVPLPHDPDPIRADRSAPCSGVAGSRDFELVRPASLAEAIRLLSTEDPAVRPFSGGTGLMLMMKSGVFRPSRLVDLSGVEPEYSSLQQDASGGMLIGSLVSLRRMELDPNLAKLAPVISDAMKRLSNVRVRNVARLGGCLAHGDPHMDLPPILASLRAQVVIRGPAGERRIPIEELFSGYYQTALGGGELITGVVIPPADGWRTVYRKMTVRTHDDWPALGVAVSLLCDGPRVRDSRVVVSAATEKLTRLPQIEALIEGLSLDEALARRAGDAAVDLVETVEDAQGSAAYKRALVGVEVHRALAAARSGACA